MPAQRTQGVVDRPEPPGGRARYDPLAMAEHDLHALEIPDIAQCRMRGEHRGGRGRLLRVDHQQAQVGVPCRTVCFGRGTFTRAARMQNDELARRFSGGEACHKSGRVGRQRHGAIVAERRARRPVKSFGKARGIDPAVERQQGDRARTLGWPVDGMVRGIEPRRHTAREREHRIGVMSEDAFEVVARQPQQAGITQRRDMGGARLAGDQRHLADGFTRADATDRFAMTVRCVEVSDQRARLHEVHRVRAVAGREQGLARRQGLRPAAVGERPTRGLVQPCQPGQRDHGLIYKGLIHLIGIGGRPT